jgi:hypothetical protein
MPAKMVKEYWAWWDIDSHFGNIHIKTDDNIVTIMQVNDAQEFAVIIDLLRNEKPLNWDSGIKRLSTYNEPVGEGEVTA